MSTAARFYSMHSRAPHMASWSLDVVHVGTVQRVTIDGFPVLYRHTVPYGVHLVRMVSVDERWEGQSGMVRCLITVRDGICRHTVSRHKSVYAPTVRMYEVLVHAVGPKGHDIGQLLPDPPHADFLLPYDTYPPPPPPYGSVYFAERHQIKLQ